MSISIFEIAALSAALSWAISSLLSRRAVEHLGAFSFNRWRLSMMFAFMGVYVVMVGSWRSISLDDLPIILLSGFIGIFLGDTALFGTLRHLGPRRSAMLFSLNAPMSALLGWWFLAEYLSIHQSIGIVLCTIGVIIAIIANPRKGKPHQWESIKGRLWVGILLGLLAALGQSVGSLIIAPLLSTGVDPIAVGSLRIGVAALSLQVLLFLPYDEVRAEQPINMPIAGIVFLSGVFGMAIGTSLILFALSGGEVGIVSTLSATTPALLLPLIWIITKQRPVFLAWCGAALVVFGCALIFS